MIFTATELIEDAAGRLGDPSRRRVTDARWLPILRQIVRETSNRMSLLVQRATFDITLDDRYPYPDGMTKVLEMRYNPDPAGDVDAYYTLTEKDTDWLRDQTQSQYADGDPLYYVPTPSWFHLFPRGGIAITDGGRIDYRTVPELPTAIDGLIDLPMAAVDHIVAGMTIEALRDMKYFDEAELREKKWLEEEPNVESVLRARSDDRRKAFMPVHGLGAQV